jgi:hypothetical protein
MVGLLHCFWVYNDTKHHGRRVWCRKSAHLMVTRKHKVRKSMPAWWTATSVCTDLLGYLPIQSNWQVRLSITARKKLPFLDRGKYWAYDVNLKYSSKCIFRGQLNVRKNRVWEKKWVNARKKWVNVKKNQYNSLIHFSPLTHETLELHTIILPIALVAKATYENDMAMM